jgi:hypothetical protein
VDDVFGHLLRSGLFACMGADNGSHTIGSASCTDWPKTIMLSPATIATISIRSPAAFFERISGSDAVSPSLGWIPPDPVGRFPPEGARIEGESAPPPEIPGPLCSTGPPVRRMSSLGRSAAPCPLGPSGKAPGTFSALASSNDFSPCFRNTRGLSPFSPSIASIWRTKERISLDERFPEAKRQSPAQSVVVGMSKMRHYATLSPRLLFFNFIVSFDIPESMPL